MAVHGQTPAGYLEEVTQLVQHLTQAIAEGNLNKGRNITAELGKMRAKVELTAVDPRSPTIGIDVRLQKRGENRGTIRLHVQANFTFKHLKYMMFRQHRLPVESQRWVHRRQFPNDDVTLESLGITNGSTLGLYVMSEGFANRPQDPPAIDVGAAEVVRRPDVEQTRPVGGAQGRPGGAQGRPGGAQGRPGGAAKRPAPGPPLPQFKAVRPPPPAPPPTLKWRCGACTFSNQPTRPSCEVCSADRPPGFVVPQDYTPTQEERRRMEEEKTQTMLFIKTQKREQEEHDAYVQENLERIVQEDDNNYVVNTERFECPICFTEVEPGEGIVIRNCVHEFCVACLGEHVRASEGAVVKCPFTNGDYQCDVTLEHREICGLVSPDDYQKFLQRSVTTAEGQEKNSFHCKTPNCQGWCIYEDDVNTFPCPICQKRNCLSCKVIHAPQSCKEYQYDLRRRAEIDVEVRATLEGLERMLATGDAMHCPHCNVVIQKNGGCPNMTCSQCGNGFKWTGR